MMHDANILFIGDIVGNPGRDLLIRELPKIIVDEKINFVIANVENVASGFGINQKIYETLCSLNIDAFTSGNHIYRQKEFLKDFDKFELLVRPLNYPVGHPGKGYRFFDFFDKKIAVVNLIGRVFMDCVDCPFRSLESVLQEIREITPNIIVDFHAEATSEKQALAWYFNGQVSAVLGTHTHVQTADARLLDGKTAFITDVGMVGTINSVIGMKKEIIINRFIVHLPEKFQIENGWPRMINAVKLNINLENGKVNSIARIFKNFDS